MEGHCSTGQNPQWAVVPMEEEGIVQQVNTYRQNKTGNVKYNVPLRRVRVTTAAMERQ